MVSFEEFLSRRNEENLSQDENNENIDGNFSTLTSKITLSLDRISELGIDVTKYREYMEQVLKEVNVEIKNASVQVLAKNKIQSAYRKGYAKLQALNEELLAFNLYVQVYNSCLYIDEVINDNDISNEKLLELISLMVNNLMKLANQEGTGFSDEERIVKKIYTTAYNLIKYEIIHTGDSKLLANMKEKDPNVIYLSDLILVDLKQIEGNSSIKQRLYEIKSLGVNSNYADIDLVRFILLSDKKLNLKKTVKKRIINGVSELEHSNDEIRDLLKKIARSNTEGERYESLIKHYKKEIRKRITAYGLALSLFIAGGVEVTVLTKKGNTYDYYNQTKKVYSTISDDVELTKEEVYGDVSDTTEIIVYDKYSGGKTRDYVVYDVSSYDDATIKEFFENGIDTNKVFPKAVETDTAPSGYEDSYRELVIKTYEYLETKTDGWLFALELLLMYLIYISVSCLLLLGIDKITDNGIDRLTEETIKELTHVLNDVKKSSSESYQELDRLVGELYKKVMMNEEMRTNFYKLYKQNLFLLNDEEELKCRIEELFADNKQLLSEIESDDVVRKHIKGKN